MSTFETLSFYRGLAHSASLEHPFIVNVRKDRKPRDSKYETHLRADAWFQRKFGVRYRSQAVFITSSLFTAENYSRDRGVVVRVIPLDKYSYCWSPVYNDLLSFQSSSNTDIESYLEKGNYIQTDLDKAYECQHEVMLFCDRYVAIPAGLVLDRSEISPEPAKSIIIP